MTILLFINFFFLKKLVFVINKLNMTNTRDYHPNYCENQIEHMKKKGNIASKSISTNRV